MELRVNRCCCLSLRTGGLVLGWLGLVAVIVHSIMIIISLVEYHSGVRYGAPYATVESFDPIREYVNIAIYLFDVVLSGIMIYGIIKNKHLMLLPYLIIKATGLVLAAPSCILLMISALISADPALIALGLIVISLVGLGCWCWVVIFSLYKEIHESTKQPLTVYMRSSLDNVPVPPYKEFDSKSYGPNYI